MEPSTELLKDKRLYYLAKHMLKKGPTGKARRPSYDILKMVRRWRIQEVTVIGWREHPHNIVRQGSKRRRVRRKGRREIKHTGAWDMDDMTRTNTWVNVVWQIITHARKSDVWRCEVYVYNWNSPAFFKSWPLGSTFFFQPIWRHPHR